MIDHVDSTFMLISITFVMLQTPAIGIVQAGLIQKKNVLSMLM